MSKPKAAVALKVSKPLVYDWISGARRPSAIRRDAIERWTGGLVKSGMWRTEDETTALDETGRAPRVKRAGAA